MPATINVAVGDPPENEAAACVAIDYAFVHVQDTDDAGIGLVNVQSGAGLLEPLQQAQERIPGRPQGAVGLVVDDISS